MDRTGMASPSGGGGQDGAFQARMAAFLGKRIHDMGDLPAFPEVIGHIGRIASSENNSIAELSSAILKDPSLTIKLLRLVNSPIYSQHSGGNVSTISRAVAVIGFDAVTGNILALTPLDHLKNRRMASRLRNEYLRAQFSGALARELSLRIMARCPEEALVCATFRNLGRLLAMYYFPEEAEEVSRIMARQAIAEDAAALLVLGVSYRDLGMAQARDWCFPEQIVHAMGTLPDGPVSKPENNMDTLLVLAMFADEICEAIDRAPCEEMPDEVGNTILRFAEALPLTEFHLASAVEDAVGDIIRYANLMQVNLQKMPFGSRIGQTEEGETISNAPGCAVIPEIDAAALDDPNDEGRDEAARDILAAGIGDISDALVAEKPLAEILHGILKILWRGMGFRHVLLCTISGENKEVMKARFGYGEDIELLIPNFKFQLNGSDTVFQAAVASGTDIIVADADDPRIQKRIPDWLRQIATARTFAVFPLNIRSKPAALIYADKDAPGEIRLGSQLRSQLHVLRNLAVLALQRKH